MDETTRPNQSDPGKYSISIQEYVEALVEPVSQRIRAGDVTLREYIERIITEHKEFVVKLFDDADRLEQERISAIERTIDERWARVEEQIKVAGVIANESIEQLRRERGLVTSAQNDAIMKAEQVTSLAIKKAEDSVDKRFDSVNEFRQQQTDIISRFLPREVADAQFADVRRAITDLTEKISKIA